MQSLWTRIISIAYMMVITQSDNNQIEPDCNRATTPFQNEGAVLDSITHILVHCGYNYWKVDATDSYRGLPGFIQMFGDEGHIWNQSSIIETDDKIQQGYRRFRQNSIVSQNLIVFHEEPADIQIHNWSNYSMFYSWTMSVGLNIGRWKDTEEPQTIRVFSYRRYFQDDSQIVQHDWSNSSQSAFAGLIQNMFDSTRAISNAMGYLDGDGDEKVFGVLNPIQFIFICVVFGTTVIVGIGVCVFVKCATRKKGTHTKEDEAQQIQDLKLKLEKTKLGKKVPSYSESDAVVDGITIKTMSVAKVVDCGTPPA